MFHQVRTVLNICTIGRILAPSFDMIMEATDSLKTTSFSIGIAKT